MFTEGKNSTRDEESRAKGDGNEVDGKEKSNKRLKQPKKTPTEGTCGNVCIGNAKNCESESTIYQRAVKRGSSSSEEDGLVNLSDEMVMGMEAELVEVDSEVNFIIGKQKRDEKGQREDERGANNGHRRSYEHDRVDARPGCSYQENPQEAAARRYEEDIDARLDKVIRDADLKHVSMNSKVGM